MRRNYYLVAIKPNVPGQEYPIRINRKGFFGNQYIYQLRNQRFYGSMFSYIGTLYYKFVLPLFPFENEGLVIKRRQAGHLAIRSAT